MQPTSKEVALKSKGAVKRDKHADQELGSSHFHSNILCLLTQGEVCFWCLCLCVHLVVIQATFWCWRCSYFIGSRLVFQDGQRWFSNSEDGFMDLGKERAERVLASAISIDGRKEWTCKFCSESNVSTRWRCRRRYHDIPAGLRGKYRQAIAASTGEWSTGSSTSSGEEDRKSKSFIQERKLHEGRVENAQGF